MEHFHERVSFCCTTLKSNISHLCTHYFCFHLIENNIAIKPLPKADLDVLSTVSFSNDKTGDMKFFEQCKISPAGSEGATFVVELRENFEFSSFETIQFFILHDYFRQL